MNHYITEIVRIDHECQEAVKAAEHEKASVSEHMNEKRTELYEAYAKEYASTLEERKNDLRAQIEAIKAQNDAEYEQSLKKLKDVYEARRDELVDTLVARCLE